LFEFKLSSPWVIFYKEINAVFGKDPDINVVFDDEKNEIKLHVKDATKADAISQILPEKKTFGNYSVTVTVIPENNNADTFSLFTKAFKGNPVFAGIKKVDNPIINDVKYILFKPEVVQFFNDDMSDANGLESTLYQDIAEDIFRYFPNTFYCTEPVNKELKKPLGEWP
jgi:hypothetical protein